MSHESKWKNLSKEKLISEKNTNGLNVPVDENGLPNRPPGRVIIDPIKGNIGNTINDGEGFHWKNWVNYWHPGEWLWQGTIDKKYFRFDPLSDTIADMYLYLSKCKYNQIVPDDYVWDTTGDYDLENFTKIIWLLNEYKDGGWRFTNNLSSHYNPRSQEVQIHPGEMRNKVVDLFGATDVPVYFFNTTGFYHSELMGKLEPMDLESFAENTDWWGACMADHGSIIPQLMKDVHTIGEHKKIWHKRLSERAQTLKIYTNRDKRFFAWWTRNVNDEMPEGWDDGPVDLLRDKWFTNNVSEANVMVTFIEVPHVTDNPGRPSNRDQVIAMLCSFAKINYESQTLIVKCH